MPKQGVIHGRYFLQWLIDNQVVPERTRRVVIEADIGSAVRIYVETWGTESLISVTPPPELKGAQVLINGIPVDKVASEQ